MSLIVAARFDTFEAAENAARRLFREGFTEESVSIFFVTQPGEHGTHPIGGDRTSDPAARKSPGGSIMGALGIGLIGLIFGAVAAFVFEAPVFVLIVTTLVGAYIGSLLGALVATKRDRPLPQPGQPTGRRYAGVLTAVHVTAETDELAARILRDMGGKDVEQATGRWRDGQWVDFDPVHSPVLSEKVPANAG